MSSLTDGHRGRLFNIEATLKKANRPAQIYYFPGADHGFSGADEIKRKNLVFDFLNKI